jgi:hypothetical protein
VFALSVLLAIASRPVFAQTTPADRLKAIQAISRRGGSAMAATSATGDLNSRCRRRTCSPISTQLVSAFGDANPQYRGHLFYEKLPPGLLLKQMNAGGHYHVR